MSISGIMADLFTILVSIAWLFANGANAERVLGVYIFQRHGDRTAKALPPTKLTELGSTQEYTSGNFYHDRYIASGTAGQIDGISPKIVNLAQVTASGPQDNVILASGQAFLQGLYPPVGATAGETLRNGATIKSPLGGFQFIPITNVKSGGGSEDSTWLQGTSACNKAEASSNNYYSSPSYQHQLSSTTKLYQSLESLTNGAVPPSQMNFKNAFTIWDLFSVALIHNDSSSFPASSSFTDHVMPELLVLANDHEFNLAYNKTDKIRAVAGMTLAGQVLSALNQTISSGGKSKLNIQFGAYSTFLSYFGLAGLSEHNANFTGMPNYASSMVWELVTNTSGPGIPRESDISVRFRFHNGTSIPGETLLQAHALFGQSAVEIRWPQFVNYTKQIAITSQSQWCQACGNTTGICSSVPSTGIFSTTAGALFLQKSLVLAGVTGAMVTLGVFAVLTTLIVCGCGLRLVRKKTLKALHREAEAAVSTPEVKSA